VSLQIIPSEMLVEGVARQAPSADRDLHSRPECQQPDERAVHHQRRGRLKSVPDPLPQRGDLAEGCDNVPGTLTR
jgi:hypothetical protein